MFHQAPAFAGDRPVDEGQRLGEVLCREARVRLDALCVQARSMFNVPVAQITPIGSGDETLLASDRVDLNSAWRHDIFCGYTVLKGDVLVVPDTRDDERVEKNALLADEMEVRFYAGAPLKLSPTLCIGVLSIMDTKPRSFSEMSEGRLRMLAALALYIIRGRSLTIDLKRERESMSENVQRARAKSPV